MNRFKIILDTSNLGIMEGDKKRALECYVDAREFQQRKSYDEYFLNNNLRNIELDIRDLLILAEQFIVTVGVDTIYLGIN